MAPVNRITRLLSLAEREFNSNRAAPVLRKFKGMKIDTSKLDDSWDRRRGSAVRTMAVLLRDDHEALGDRVNVDGKTREAFKDAVSWFKKEAAYLRKIAARYDIVAGRLAAVLSRPVSAADSI